MDKILIPQILNKFLTNASKIIVKMKTFSKRQEYLHKR